MSASEVRRAIAEHWFTADPVNSFTELGTRYFRAVELLEVSLVSVPANPAATIRQVKAFKDCQNIRDFESAVREALGLSAKQAKVLAARGWPALHRDEEETAIDIEKAVSLLTAATKTLRGINHV
ncbi:hypothetical protein EAW52_10985 [Pseudomonas sp. LTJR-52]|uniref:HK97 family phage prohead protease n=1 Tax=Pseudomonas sp. LTJR-52 TaxID=2479392 RepID=UPI000EFB2A4F|nr:hypothetical protein EAW52_10985 [Pseudomonas sp. LTJR-52]